MEFAMTEEVKTNYCIVGGGIAGVILASKLAPFGKKSWCLSKGPDSQRGTATACSFGARRRRTNTPTTNEAGVLIHCYGRISQKPSKGGYHGRDNEGETEWD